MIRRGEIYWISPGRTRGREQAGLRPALIIQNDRGNQASDTTIVALMTSRMFARDYPMRVIVDPQNTGLRERSTILLEQIQTVAIERLGRRAGQLSAEVMPEVDRALHHSLGLIGCPITQSSAGS